jgi:hypothetical protein
MRAAEEPLRSDLDVAGLKEQVLGRIEELEKRERERGEVVLVLAPLPHVLGGSAMPQWAKASRKRPSIFLTMPLTYSTLQWKRTIGHHEAVKAYSVPSKII